jgi:hypothetical protein
MCPFENNEMYSILPDFIESSYGCVAFEFDDESMQSSSTSASIPCAAFLLQDYLLDIPDLRTNFETNEQEMILPHNYIPTMYDVICGRGKGHYNKPGNKRFRTIVSQYVESYKPCQSRIHKSLILQQIIERVQEQDNGRAQFLRYDSKLKCWCRMSLDHTREKVGHAMRECSQSSSLSVADKQKRSAARSEMMLLRKMYSTSGISIIN